MDFKPLPNPNPNPDIQYNPTLLYNMEHNQFAHSTSSPFNTYKPPNPYPNYQSQQYPPQPNQPQYYPNMPTHPHTNKKQKQHHLNSQAKPYIYQGHPYPLYQPIPSNPGQTSAQPNPPPQNQNFVSPPQTAPILTYHRRKRLAYGPRIPRLLNMSNVGKLSKMMKAVQPGMMVFIPQRGTVHGFIMTCKWDNLIFYRGQSYHTYLMGEFYGNLVTKRDENKIFELDSVVHGRNVHIDVNSICRALKLSPEILPQPYINIYEVYKFNKEEFEMYVGFFCGDSIPTGLCAVDCGIAFKYFLPDYQQLAIILRANLLPKAKNNQYFDFLDFKVMYQLVTNKVEFNIIYVIILNMFVAFQEDFMPYGLLLTAIFELFKIPMPRVFADRIEYCNVERLVVPKVPLKDIKPYRFVPIGRTSEDVNHDYIRESEILKKMLKESKENFKDLRNQHLKVCARLAEIEEKMGLRKESDDLDSKADEVTRVVVEQELMESGIIDQFASLPELSDFPPDLGFVAANP